MRALDGPARGVSLMLRTCPHFLRLVQNPATGGWDALDQPDDKPKPTENVHAYVIVEGTWGVVFVRPGGRYEMGDYRHIADVPEDLVNRIRDRDEWIKFLDERFPEVAAQYGRTVEHEEPSPSE